MAETQKVKKKFKVAVYAIALNEEQFVERWYESAKDADYVLLADTGSTDKTVEIAQKLGINVIHIKVAPWRFDDARNAALAAVPADIDMCVTLDLDEIITPNWREPLEDMWRRGITRPKYRHIWSWTPEGNPGLEFAYDHIHSRNGYRWKHPVHETLVPYGVQEVREFTSAIETHHHADPTKSRAQYLPLLEMSVKEDPHSDRNSFYFARELYFYNLYERAKEEFKRHLSIPTSTWAPERATSMRYLAKVDPESSASWLLMAIKEAPGRREALVELSNHYYQEANWDECYEYAKAALDIKEKPLDYLCEEFAWGALPWDLAAISAYNLKKYEEAVNYGKTATDLAPSDLRLKTNLAYYLAAVAS
jgi:glycosyltransferase involved in cell wall biosynthesis